MGFTIKSNDYDQELSVNNGSKCKSNYVTKNKEYILVKNNAVTDSIWNYIFSSNSATRIYKYYS